MAVVGQQYTVIYFAMLPAQRFWRETVSLLDSRDLEVNSESAPC